MPRKPTNAAILWEWALKRDEFTVQEAVDETGIAYKTLMTCLTVWKKAGAAVQVRALAGEGRGRRAIVWKLRRNRRRPAVWNG